MAAGFMAGFGTTLSKLIEEDRQYYRAKAEKRKDYLQTYGTKAVVDIEGKANDALAVANQLQNYGFSKEFVTGITAKGGVRSMYDFAKHSMEKSGQVDISEDDMVVKVSGSFRCGGQEHFYLETNSSLVIPSESATDLTVYTSTQAVNKTQMFCAAATNTPAARVVVRMKRMGGGFGGKGKLLLSP